MKPIKNRQKTMLTKTKTYLIRAKEIIDITKSLVEITTFAAAIFGAIYAFLYPAAVAQKVATFQEMIAEARTDVGIIRQNTTVISENTGGILDNTTSIQSHTEKLAAAIPSWARLTEFYRFRIGMLKEGVAVGLENPSPYPLEVKVTLHFDSGEPDASKLLQIMPGETSYFSAHAGTSQTKVLMCLEGTGPGLKGRTIYERRSLDWPKYERIIQDISPIEDCK